MKAKILVVASVTINDVPDMTPYGRREVRDFLMRIAKALKYPQAFTPRWKARLLAKPFRPKTPKSAKE